MSYPCLELDPNPKGANQFNPYSKYCIIPLQVISDRKLYHERWRSMGKIHILSILS